jgi:hypothetical protein
MKNVVRVPFEEMPQSSSSMSLSDAINPQAGSSHEFTKVWMDRVGPDQYFRQLQEFHLNLRVS